MTIFISYSSRDADAVRTFTQHLEQAGHQVWLDQDLHGGDAWWAAILGQIRECEIFILALSQNSLDSQPCRAEVAYATSLGVPILPVQIGEVDSYRIDPIFVKQSIDYRNPTVTTGFALTNAMRDSAALRGPLPNPLPDPPPIPYEYLLRLGETIRGSAPVPHHEQSGLLQQLRQALRDESEESVRADIRSLLHALRNRPEATHVTVTAIDETLAEQSRLAGWYPDNSGVPGQQRFWDGSKWTEHVTGGATTGPLPQPPKRLAPLGNIGNSAGAPHVSAPPFVPTPPTNPAPAEKSDSNSLSITTFVLSALALLIPFIGVGAVVCGFIALGRKERLGVTAVAVSIGVTILAFGFWALIYSG
jgi:hypothetical protein